MPRHRNWGSLPDPLINQIPSYLDDYAPGQPGLVHGDVTEDHVFIDNFQFTGLIDWGDAMVTDPFYELGALHLGTFGADRGLLTAFLKSYEWPIDDQFNRRAMQVALMHEFDMFTGTRQVAAEATTLTELADLLWLPQP